MPPTRATRARKPGASPPKPKPMTLEERIAAGKAARERLNAAAAARDADKERRDPEEVLAAIRGTIAKMDSAVDRVSDAVDQAQGRAC